MHLMQRKLDVSILEYASDAENTQCVCLMQRKLNIRT